MKKLALICLCGLVAASIMTGCGASQTEGKENLGTVELAEYKGVKVNVPAVMVTDAEVESKINQVLSQNPKLRKWTGLPQKAILSTLIMWENRTAWNLQAAPAKDRT